jgi:hypothetical protein
MSPLSKKKNNKIPKRYINENSEIKSLSNCNTCHKQALTGSYAEREINIPGLGRWDD